MILINIRIYGEERNIENGYIVFNETIEAFGSMEDMPISTVKDWMASGYSGHSRLIDQQYLTWLIKDASGIKRTSDRSFSTYTCPKRVRRPFWRRP